MKYFNIKQKLILMIALIILPMFILQTILITKQIKQSVEVELQLNQDFAQAVNVSFMNFLENIWDTELSIGSAISEQNGMSVESVEKYMKNIALHQPTVIQYLWVDPFGTVLADSSGKVNGINIAYRNYFKSIIQGNDKVVSDLLESQTTNTQCFVLARGIKTDDQLKGIVIAIIDTQKLGTVLPSNRAKDSSTFGLIDSEGYFVYRHGIKDIANQRIKISDDSPASRALKGEIVKASKYKSPVTGSYYMGADVPISRIGWAATANTSYMSIMNQTLADIKRDIIVLFIISVLSLIIAFQISQYILQSLNRLRKSAQEISNGNLNVQVNIRGNDELAAAGQAFDHMVKSICEYDKLKTHFFSTISHELKTPLNIILSSIQMLDKLHKKHPPCDLMDKTQKYSGMMRQNCLRLLRLINNLIDITRIDSGFLKMNMENHNIVSVVEEITLSVAQYAEDKGINVIFDTNTEEKILACDPDKIERIILNLLSNAIKFSKPNGYIMVNMIDLKEKMVISIKDTGIGIPEDKQQIIFERFRQANASLQREHEGSGIGLSLAKALVEAHGGKISLESQMGIGSEFRVELPVEIISAGLSSNENLYQRQTADRVQRINIEFSDIYASFS